MSAAGSPKLEPLIASLLAIAGIGLTTWAAFTHAAHLVVPGATLITVGGAWLGNALARADVRIFRSAGEPEQPGRDEAA
jgi:hypothetical protein